ncbi:MAG: ABC transporter ATP-binding protein [Opitutales bacterium]|nr:ABC transporter ATP-binding protein [Opitutales bacterium]
MHPLAPHIETRGLRKAFGDQPPVLDGLDLVVEPGRIIALLGASGCGKSTLLRLIAGTLPLSGGAILFNGEAQAERPETAFIFQDPVLLPWLDTLHNISLPLRLRGMAAHERREIATERACRVGLGEALGRYPDELSGGMRMRASLARALTFSPGLMLLDEPFGALDAITRNRLNEELLALHARERWTTFFVTHSVTEAVFLADRVVILGGSPARVVDVVEIAFAQARSASLRTQIAYQQAVAETTARLYAVLPA